MSSRNTAQASQLSSCHLCMKLVPVGDKVCPCCGSGMHSRKSDSLNRTLALLLTACILYIPANVLPIMITDQFGVSIESTILGGIILLIDMGSWPIAAVIFIASVMVPIGKLITLFFLCWTVKNGSAVSPQQRTSIYRITEFIGKWSMIDVFVVAILVALVHLGGILVIRPGAAAMAFACVVIVTIFAAESFDPRLLWDQKEKNSE